MTFGVEAAAGDFAEALACLGSDLGTLGVGIDTLQGEAAQHEGDILSHIWAAALAPWGSTSTPCREGGPARGRHSFAFLGSGLGTLGIGIDTLQGEAAQHEGDIQTH